MTTESRKIQLETEVDATGARKGFEEIKTGARDMAAVVSQAGKQAGDSMGGMGEQAEKSAQKQERVTGDMIRAIQRLTAAAEAGEKGTARYYESLANQRGADVGALQPYLVKLTETQKAQELAAKAAREEAQAQKAAADEKQKAASQQQSFLASLREQTDLQGKSQAEILRYRAAQMGVSKEAEQYISQLDRAGVATGKVGISAAQTAAALRGVPAQFTDIVTSLQAGQAPMTVLLQQGGQLKDMFGGAGAAAKALGGYVVGLANAFTGTAAVAAVLALAYYQGAKEAEAFSRAIILTGNAAGVTVGQLQAQAQAISSMTGATQGAASAALAQVAGTGKVSADALGIVTEAALKLEKVGVQSVAKTVEQFADLAKSPVEASIKLNDQYNFLTASVFKQIKALEDQGRATEAAEVAQRALGETLSSRATMISQNLGTLEKAWVSITGASKAAWDAMLGIGRETSIEEKISTLQQQIADRQSRNSGLGIKDGAATRELQAQLAALQAMKFANDENAKAVAATADANALNARWQQEGDKYLTKQLMMQKEIRRATDEGQRLVKAGLIEESELNQRIAAIREKYNDNTGQSEVAGIKAKILAQQQYLDILKTQGLEAQKMTEGEKLVIQIKQQLTTSLTGVQRAEKLRALAAAEALAVVDKQVQGEERRLEGIKKSKEAYDQMVDATRKSADTLKTQADELEASNSMWGKGKVAIEQYRLALLEAKAAEVDQNPDSYRADYIAALQEKINQQRRIVIGTQTAEYKALLDKQNEWLRSAQEEAQLYQDEIGLLGLTTREREKVVAVRQVELKLAKEIAAINKSGATDDQKAVLVAQAQAAADIAKQTATAKADLNAMTDIINSVDRTAQQVWTNIWQGGSDVFTKLGQTIKASVLDLLYQLTIKKWVIGITAEILGVLGIGGSAGVGLLSAGSNAIGLGAAGSAAGTAALATTQGWLGMTGTAAQTSAAMMQGYGAGSLSGIASTAGSYVPYIAAAYAAYKILGSLNGGETRTGGQYAVAYDGKVVNNRRGETYYYDDQYFQRPGTQKTKVTNGTAYRIEADGMGTQEDAVRTAVSSTANNIQEMLKALGSSMTLNGFWAGLETSGNGRGGVFSGGSFKNGTKFGESGKGDNYSGTLYELTSTQSPDSATALANFTLDLKQVTIQALQAATDIPQTIKEKLKDVDAEKLTNEAADTLLTWITTQINNVNQLATLANSLPLQNLKNLSFDAASGLIELAGGIDTLSSQLDAYYKAYYTEDEQRAQTLANIKKALGTVGIDNLPTTLADYRKLVDSQDLSTEAGRKTYAMLIALASAFADVTKASDTAAASAKKEAESKAQAEKDAAAAKAEADKQAAISAANAAYSALETAISAQKTILQAQAQAAQATINTISSIMDTLKSNIDELYNSVATTQIQSQRQALEFIDQALTTAQAGGVLPDGTKLSDAINAARTGASDSSGYASLFEQQKAQLILAGKLVKLQEIAGVQKTVAEQQLDAANKQIDQLDKTLAYWKEQTAIATGTWKATLSVVDAINALRDANAAATAATTKKPGVVVTGASDQFTVGGGGSGTGTTAAAAPKSLREIYRAAYGWTDDDFKSWYANPLNTANAEEEAKRRGIPVMAVGTNYLPRDGYIYAHQGEAIVPRAYNPAANGVLQADGQTARLLTSLIEEVRAMRASTERTASAVEGNQSVPLLVEIAS